MRGDEPPSGTRPGEQRAVGLHDTNTFREKAFVASRLLNPIVGRRFSPKIDVVR